MSKLINLNKRRIDAAIKSTISQQGDDIAKSLVSMSNMSWAAKLTGPEALRAAAQAYQAAARKMNG